MFLESNLVQQCVAYVSPSNLHSNLLFRVHRLPFGSLFTHRDSKQLIGHTAILKDEALHLDLLEIVANKSDIVGCADTPEFLRAVQEREKYMKR